jgi:hypothetical protein
MRLKTFAAAATLTVAAMTGAGAQGLVRGAEDGAAAGRATGGPIGEIVGGAIGAATGTVNGILGVDTPPRFRSYVVRERRPSYSFGDEVRIGTVLPSDGVTYYEVPAEYGATGYHYTIINDRSVLVELGSRRIVEMID